MFVCVRTCLFYTHYREYTLFFIAFCIGYEKCVHMSHFPPTSSYSHVCFLIFLTLCSQSNCRRMIARVGIPGTGRDVWFSPLYVPAVGLAWIYGWACVGAAFPCHLMSTSYSDILIYWQDGIQASQRSGWSSERSRLPSLVTVSIVSPSETWM